MIESVKGTLEIDRERGVIYFHVSSRKVAERYGAQTILRVCQIPASVTPENSVIDFAYNNATRSANTKGEQ